jgi:hypothetical protein
MRTFAYITMLMLAVGAASAQIDVPSDTTLAPIEKSDAHWKIIQMEIEQITKGATESPIGNRLERVGRIEGKAIRTLFPGWKFYSLTYSNYAKKGVDARSLSLAAHLGHTIAVALNSREKKKLFHFGNHEEYGSLLIETKAAISNTDDAELVWDAFCEIHRKGWKGRNVEKISETEWKIGITSYDQTISIVDDISTIVNITHFMQVTTDPTSKQIVAWKSIVETSNTYKASFCQ